MKTEPNMRSYIAADVLFGSKADMCSALVMSAKCQKRTLGGSVEMSAKCQKRTLGGSVEMSAKCQDRTHAVQPKSLLGNLIGAQK
jgi:hypothetical protein